MPQSNRPTYWIILTCGFAAVLGCGTAEEPPIAAQLPAATPSVGAEKPAEAKKAADATDDVSQNADESIATIYEPPFPKRQNLFAPIQRKRTSQKTGSESGDAVVLKGFANVGEPVAVLAIDGRLAPLPAGSERFGVQVISIQPPEVILQRGRSRWTATLQ